MYNSDIFTQDVLERMEPIINNYFKYKSVTEQEETEREFENMVNNYEEQNGFSDDVDAEDLFN